MRTEVNSRAVLNPGSCESQLLCTNKNPSVTDVLDNDERTSLLGNSLSYSDKDTNYEEPACEGTECDCPEACDANGEIDRQSDLEEIRRKLAMESDSEDCYTEQCNQRTDTSSDYNGGVNLQICFMNELASDQESQDSDHESHEDSRTVVDKHMSQKSNFGASENKQIERTKKPKNLQGATNSNIRTTTKRQRSSLLLNQPHNTKVNTTCQLNLINPKEDIFTQHARLQAEARLALAQAKDMARMQMEVEKQEKKKKKSSITVIVGIPFPEGQHKMSRQFLTDMNVAQLQVIVNDLHTQIENLNEELVRLLLERDDLHMEQDSMLVDVEDFTRYLGLKNPQSTASYYTEENSTINKRGLKNQQSTASYYTEENSTANKRVAPVESGWKLQNRHTGRSRIIYKIAGLF